MPKYINYVSAVRESVSSAIQSAVLSISFNNAFRAKKMHRFVLLTTLIFIFGFQDHASGTDYELREKIHRALRNLPQLEEIKLKTQRSLQDVVENLKANFHQRKRHADKSQLVEDVESFLGRIIPNSGLVQDLMGYITMPMPRYLKEGLKDGPFRYRNDDDDD